MTKLRKKLLNVMILYLRLLYCVLNTSQSSIVGRKLMLHEFFIGLSNLIVIHKAKVQLFNCIKIIFSVISVWQTSNGTITVNVIKRKPDRYKDVFVSFLPSTWNDCYSLFLSQIPFKPPSSFFSLLCFV